MIACDCSDSPGPINKNQPIIRAVEEGSSIPQGVRCRQGDFRALQGIFEGHFAFHRRKTIRQASCIVTWPVPSLSRVKQAPCVRPGQFPPSGFRFHQLALPIEERGAGGGMNMLFKITAIFSLLMVLPVL